MKPAWKTWIDKPFALPLTVMAVIVVVAAAGFAHWEANTQGEDVGFFQGLWWAVVTVTTVGYGDFAPRTVPGRVLGMAVMASGIVLVSTITGSLASVLIERRFKKRRGMLPVMIKGHIVILGWNGHGPVLVRQLLSHGDLTQAELVLVAEMEPSAFEELAQGLGLGDRLHFSRGLATLKAAQERANPAAARMAFILSPEALGSEEADNHAVLAALTFRGLAPHVPLYAEARLEASREHLWRAGVTQAVGRDELAGLTLGFLAAHPAMHDFLQALLSGSGASAIRYRPLTAAEKAAGWKATVRACLDQGGQLPVAVCRMPREIGLTDLLDASQALDQFILQLFKEAGHDTALGSQSPKVVLNPGPDQDLAGFDGMLFLGAKP